MELNIKNRLLQLFRDHFGEEATFDGQLPVSGSYRVYARLKHGQATVVGAYNPDVKENLAFLSFTQHLAGCGVHVPEVYAVSEDRTHYLLEDLGIVTLFDYISELRKTEGFSRTITGVYHQVIDALPVIQVNAARTLDFSVCYPRAAFDRQSMLWDLSYFKYYFLKLAKIPFDEQLLEDDFQRFAGYLLGAGGDYFMYRDFQSRNIMLKDGTVFFIDYQGGRKGPLHYDLASLLYDGKADIPQAIRDELLEYYLERLNILVRVDRHEFKRYFPGFAIIRILQAMGAYGFRGFYEKKEHFLKSIPYALDNLEYLLTTSGLPAGLPELSKALQQVTGSTFLRSLGQATQNLTVRITSFSYKKGIPADPSGNGGGFVFDCRAIHNPGRYPGFKDMTGKDPDVQKFLEEKSEVRLFLASVLSLVDQSVKNYIERGFSHLSVSFGCTGGQHRSVYTAEKLAAHLRNNFPVKVVVLHRELEF